MEITGIEANLLLFALDQMCSTNGMGHIPRSQHGYDRDFIQALRDRLLAAHEHPNDDE